MPPISKLLEQLTLDHERGEDEEDYFPVPVTPWRNADLTGASGIVFDAIRRNSPVRSQRDGRVQIGD